MNKRPSILERWSITEAELTDLVDENPSLRGILLGYVAERKFHDIHLNADGVTEATKDDDHDRKKKGDRRIVYRGEQFLIEVKSLQTKLVKSVGSDQWSGKAQVDASDKRTVTFKNGSKLATTCLLRNEFDILAINCFAFGEEWRFAFALNAELPQNQFKQYTEYQRKYLLPTLIEVVWPLKPPFTDDLPALLARLHAARKKG